jgi:hypothetical protein
MKSMILVAAVLSLTAGAALAGEGNGDPFPFAAGTAAVADVPTSPTQMTGQTPLMTKMPPNSVPYGRTAMEATLRQYATVPVSGGTLVPSDGTQGAVQTANSAPPGFHEGTAADQRADALQRYLAQQQRGNANHAYAHYNQAGRAAAGG